MSGIFTSYLSRTFTHEIPVFANFRKYSFQIRRNQTPCTIYGRKPVKTDFRNVGRFVAIQDPVVSGYMTQIHFKPLILQSRCFYTRNSNKKKADPEHLDETDKSLGLLKRFHIMYKKYWYVLIPVHCVTSIIWFGSFFFAAKSGIDIVPLLEQLGVTEAYLSYLKGSDAGYYAVAYAMYKVATPFRYTVTIGGTTVSIRYLRDNGYIKPVPSRKQLQSLYADKKDVLQDRRDEFKEKYQEKKEEIMEKYHDTRDEFRKKASRLRSPKK